MSSDPFAILGAPRRPHLDPEWLKQQYLTRAATCHPDKIPHPGSGQKNQSGDDFAQLNAAYQKLLAPRDRLIALLESAQIPTQRSSSNPPREWTDLYFQLGSSCRAADELLAQWDGETSSLLKIPLYEKRDTLRKQLESHLEKVRQFEQVVLTRIREIDSSWDPDGALHRFQSEIASIIQQLTFLDRWKEMLHTPITHLRTL